MRRRLLLRLLGLSLGVASLAVVATALLATYGTGNQLQDEVDNDASLLETDSEIRTALLAYANDHASWDGVESLVRELAERTGRRIVLTTPGGEMIADSARLLGQGSGELPPVPAAHIDAADPGAAIAQAPSTAVSQQSAGLYATLVNYGWRWTEQEKRERQALADETVACLRRHDIDATLSLDDQPMVLTSDATGIGASATADEAASQLRTHPCIPDRLYAPSAAALELNDRTIERTIACLDDHGLAYEVATDSYGMDIVQPAGGGPTSRTWNDCEETAQIEAKQPYVAPAADLYLGTSDRFDPFSPEGWRRTAATAAVILLVAAAVTVIAGRRLVRPILTLTTAAQRMAAGDRTARVPTRGNDEVTRLGNAFNAMAESIETSDQQHRALVNDVAHELRTPLANVRSHLDAAEDGVVTLDAALIRSLQEESDLLERLVSDLHDLALADAGMLRIHHEERDAADLATQAVAAHRALADTSGVDLRVHTPQPVPVRADPVRLRQALGNLVTNAVTHTPAGGSVNVAVARKDGSVLITVTDTGRGIAPQHLPHVFDRFYRADPSRSRTTGGSGLGLAITKHLVEAHHGGVDVTSTPGEGSVFTIHLPAPTTRPEPD
jgi:two-component system sensor histidine kinase BaeS